MIRDSVSGSLVIGRLSCTFGAFRDIKSVLDYGTLVVAVSTGLPSFCRGMDAFCREVDTFCRVDTLCRVDTFCRGVDTCCKGVDVMMVSVACTISCKSS